MTLQCEQLWGAPQTLPLPLAIDQHAGFEEAQRESPNPD
jgi:hypothetical protein